MAILIKCTSCGKSYNVKDETAGKVAKCPGCGGKIPIPSAPVAAGPPDPPPANKVAGPASPPASPPQGVPASPAPPSDAPAVASVAQSPPAAPAEQAAPASPQPAAAGLQTMKCQSCGGTVEYQNGQGMFQCNYCGSKYNSTRDSTGQFSLEIVELVKQVIRAGDEMEVARLQEKAGNIQDKIDFGYVQFHHSWSRKAGSAATICWIAGALLAIIGASGDETSVGLILFGIGLIGVGVALFFLVFKKAEAAFVAESNRIENEELESVFNQLRQKGAGLEGGNVALGYTESTKTPLRYCVSCHQNATPQKGKGAGGMLSGVNLALTIITCGMWLPAWFFIAIISKAGGAARRAVAKGSCPMCGTTPMFPARIKNV